MSTVQRTAELLARLARESFPTGVAHPSHYAASSDEGYTFIEKATAYGFRKLGAGYFSIVFEHTDHPNIAFKFGVKAEDSGAAYAMWARANPGRHVPEIMFAERYSFGYCVVMPKYTPFTFDVQHWQAIAGYHVAQSAIHTRPTDAELAHMGKIGMHTYEELARTAANIGRYFSGVCEIDLHGENVMLHRDSDWDEWRIIITDPVSYNRTKRAEFNPDRSLPVVVA